MKVVASEFTSASSFFLQSASTSTKIFNRFLFPPPPLCPMFYEKCFRFQLLKKSNASEFAPLPASFFKVLPIPKKFNHFHRFRFQLSLPHPWIRQILGFKITKIKKK